MSRERELLRRLLENFEQPVAGRFGDLFDEVRELLSTPEPTQNEEPVAWFSQTSRTFSTVETSHHTAPLFLYPAPRPEFVRLSEEEITRIGNKTGINWNLPRAIQDALIAKNSPTIPSLNDTISADSGVSGHE